MKALERGAQLPTCLPSFWLQASSVIWEPEEKEVMERHLSCCLIKGSLNIHSFGIRKRKVPLGSRQRSDEGEKAFSIRYLKNLYLLFSSYQRLPGKTTTAVVTWTEVYAQAWCIMTISKPANGSPHYLRCLINPGAHGTFCSAALQIQAYKPRRILSPDIHDVQLLLHFLHSRHVL